MSAFFSWLSALIAEGRIRTYASYGWRLQPLENATIRLASARIATFSENCAHALIGMHQPKSDTAQHSSLIGNGEPSPTASQLEFFSEEKTNSAECSIKPVPIAPSIPPSTVKKPPFDGNKTADSLPIPDAVEATSQTATNEKAPARILLVADLSIIRRGFAQVLNATHDFVVCGEADTPRKAIDAVAELKPDLAILDVTSTGRIELIADIVAMDSQLPILAFSLHDNFNCAERAILAGAQGYIVKNDTVERLPEALRKISNGGLFVSDELSTYILSKRISGKPPEGVDSLSNREFDVMRRIGEGCMTRKIAEDLGLSIKTIEAHQAHLKEKLNLPNAPKLACFAVQWTILNTQGSSQPTL